ncbi:MAG: alkaline phosphatase D family protein [Verrucomicrobiota bacterium]
MYWTHNYGEGEESVKVLLLDVRYHRDRPGPADADVLGDAQWEWLEEELQKSEATLNVVVSGIQILHVDHRYEKWEDFPEARERLLNAAGEAKGRVVFLSGDRHIGELAKLERGDDKREFVEVTASGLSHSWEDFPGEMNRYRVGEVYPKKNFGTMIVDWDEEELALQIRSEMGEIVKEMVVGL